MSYAFGKMDEFKSLSHFSGISETSVGSFSHHLNHLTVQKSGFCPRFFLAKEDPPPNCNSQEFSIDKYTQVTQLRGPFHQFTQIRPCKEVGPNALTLYHQLCWLKKVLSRFPSQLELGAKVTSITNYSVHLCLNLVPLSL